MENRIEAVQYRDTFMFLTQMGPIQISQGTAFKYYYVISVRTMLHPANSLEIKLQQANQGVILRAVAKDARMVVRTPLWTLIITATKKFILKGGFLGASARKILFLLTCRYVCRTCAPMCCAHIIAHDEEELWYFSAGQQQCECGNMFARHDGSGSGCFPAISQLCRTRR